MEFERYEDVIDAYERDNMGYATLTDYIKGENIKIKEIEMDPLGDLKQSLKKGGPVGLEVLIMEKMKDGGRVPFRFGGAMGSRYGGGSKSGPSQGPAGGASAGGNYGGNRNPQQTYGGSIFRGGGGGPRPGTGSAGPAGGATRKITPTTSKFGIAEFAKKYNPLNLVFGTPVEAEEFKLEDLKNLGAVEKGFFGGNKLSDKGEALEKFRETATNFKFSKNNPAKTPQAALDLITSDKFRGTYGKSDMVKEKDFIQTAIDKGFSGKEEDYGLQKPLDKYLADGGRVGFNVGGITDPQALAIYNSMNAYGFSDKEIADAITAQGYDAGTLGQTTTPTTPTTPTPSEGIIGIDLQQRDTGGGFNPFGPLQSTFTKDLSGIKGFEGLTPFEQMNKYKAQTQDNMFGLAKFFQPKIRGTLGTRLQKQFEFGQKLPSPLAQLAGAQSPFNIDSKNYNPDFVDQLNYLEGMEGLIGMSSVGLKYGPESVLFGKNVISGFGTNNYQKALEKFIAKARGDRKIKAQTELDNFLAAEKARKEKQDRERQDMLEAAIRTRRDSGESLSDIGRDMFTGPGQAFEARKDTFSGGKVKDTGGVPGGKYGSPR